ncbi:hypothetical protein SAMN04488003_108137 [Loktanella fryxellensis]|uniref:Uncharacterized protein n=1 Tax=Loktanella fryxellensis TaxID=245187 RepID=A0A1H8DI89_9RHOB|nr:hypothetical protein [Loktanella fryxellensis]SEN06247.1 hypothetical protein SAMN04488003_108137 [Loktanella fryxellensis]
MIRLPLLTCLALLTPFPASAQGATCLPLDDMRDLLRQHYAEAPLGLGLTADGAVLELLTAADGTWTITLTTAGGPTCIVASGTAFGLMHRDGLYPSQPV